MFSGHHTRKQWNFSLLDVSLVRIKLLDRSLFQSYGNLRMLRAGRWLLDLFLLEISGHKVCGINAVLLVLQWRSTYICTPWYVEDDSRRSARVSLLVFSITTGLKTLTMKTCCVSLC